MNKTSGSLHLTKKVDYGLFLLACLGENKEAKISIKTVADESKISFPFLQKVARLLLQAKLIQAERGKYGGYSLTKPLSKITFGNVIETLDGPIAMTQCLHPEADNKCCQRISFCRVRKGLQKIDKEIKTKILSTPLDKIIN